MAKAQKKKVAASRKDLIKIDRRVRKELREHKLTEQERRIITTPTNSPHYAGFRTAV